MCGMVGLFGNIVLKHERFFQDLWQVDVLRGDDSSGVAFVNPQNHIRVLKEVGTPYEVMYTKQFIKAQKKIHRCILGHNRFATVGAVTAEMAHPHLVGNICGTHNGTLRNRENLPDKKKFASDSEQLFSSINTLGLEKTWKKLEGAAAIVWWDKTNKTLNMLKNAERTLYFTFIDGENTGPVLVWASEAWMLTAIAGRHNLIIGTVWRPLIDTHYSFSYDSKKKIVSYSSRQLEKFTYVYQQKKDYKWPHAGKIWNIHKLAWEFPKKEANNYKSEIKNKLPFSVENNVVNGLIYKNMTLDKFVENYHTCAYCEGDLGDDAYDTCVIVDVNLAICKNCVGLSETCGMPFKE